MVATSLVIHAVSLTVNIRKRRNRTHRQSPVTGIVSAQSREEQSCPWQGAGEAGQWLHTSGSLPHLRQDCRRNASAGQAVRFHGAHPWRVAEAKKALLGWHKPTHQLNTKKKKKQQQKRTLYREQTFSEEGDSPAETDLVSESESPEPLPNTEVRPRGPPHQTM